MVILVQELCEARREAASGSMPKPPPRPEQWGGEEDGSPTLERVLLHVDLIELVGANEDTVVGEVDTAAGFGGLDLLR